MSIRRGPNMIAGVSEAIGGEIVSGDLSYTAKNIAEVEEKIASGEITENMTVFVEEDDGSEYDVSNETVEFTESEELAELVSGETLGDSIGKLAKGLKLVGEHENTITEHGELIETKVDKNEINALFNKSGWWRVAEFNSQNKTELIGGYTYDMELIINKVFSETSNENHHIGFIANYTSMKFYDINHFSASHNFSIIRYVADYDNNKGYIDVYYNTDKLNNCKISIVNGREVYHTWKVIKPTLVEDLGTMEVLASKPIPPNVEFNTLTANRNVYVDATNGDDATGDGTQAKPWATIQKAVDECPRIGTCEYTYTIIIADGEYNELVKIRGKKITFKGSETENGVIITKGIQILDYSKVTLGFSIKIISSSSNGAIYVDNAVLQTISNSNIEIDGASSYPGLNVSTNGYALLTNSEDKLRFYNCSNAVMSIGMIYSGHMTIDSSNSVGLYANGGFISINVGAKNNATTKYKSSTGGRINYGAQEWKLIGSVTGANSVVIDSNLYTEFMVRMNDGSTCFNIPILANDVPTDSGVRYYGQTYNDGTITSARCAVRNGNISLTLFKFGTNDKLASATMTVYGRRA